MSSTAERRPDAANAALHDLLEVVGGDPVELAAALRALREQQQRGEACCGDLLRAEFRFLEKEAMQPGASAELRLVVERAALAQLDLERRSLLAAGDAGPAALFDLAEARAAYRARGMDNEAAALAAEIDRRVEAIAVDEALVGEASERYAVLATEGEDLPLRHKVLLLQETQRVMARLAARADNALLRRMQRRLRYAAEDHGLAERVERLFGPRGARAFELFSLSLLVVLFVLIGIELTVPLSERVLRAFLFADAAICGFFIVEFLLKLVLAPSRRSWFLRHMWTDLLPALPVVFLLPGVPEGLETIGDTTPWLRALRFLRVAYFARTLVALRPLLHLVRLLLFLVRGLDSLVRRFSPLLNRNFVLFEGGSSWRMRERPPELERRRLLFRALRREHVLIADLPRSTRTEVELQRALHLVDDFEGMGTESAERRARPLPSRDVPIEETLSTLYSLTADELGTLMPRQDILALDRVVRVINAPFIRSIPFLRRLRSPELAGTAAERVVDFGRRIAARLELWRGRILFFADMHGILTGPQVLDRIATALVTASKRPAIRLLLFGGLFLIVRGIVGEHSAVGEFLQRFVATPLLVLGGVCLVLLLIGRWMKRLAGEAAESLKRTSEAHFISLLELLKSRQQAGDVAFLARRLFATEIDVERAERMLATQVERTRQGTTTVGEDAPDELRGDVIRAALLYLHFLDGAILHESDVKTTQQLLANLSLENIRLDHLCFTRKDRKRLRKLSIDESGGFGLSGPLLWFRCITESVALECAKRVIDYNRHCLTRAQRAVVPPERVARMDAWLEERRAENSGRRIERATTATAFATTEFNAFDFLTDDRDREQHIERLFGADVLAVLRADRRRMIREIFGTRPLADLPRSRRSLNFYVYYTRHLSAGRILLLPLHWLFGGLRLMRYGFRYTTGIVREILVPERALRERQSGRASFGVALRKIHRMKAPGLLEAMFMRAAFDPVYAGEPPTWSEAARRQAWPELERDMTFLHMQDHERVALREIAAAVRRRVEACHQRMRRLGDLEASSVAGQRRLGEQAVTISYVTDRGGLRTLLEAQDWFEAALPRMESAETRLPSRWLRAFLGWLWRGLRPHPVRLWLLTHHRGHRISRRGQRNFRRAYHADAATRHVIDTWRALPPTTPPAERGLALARRYYLDHGEVSRELSALRAVQSLSVLDVRNYRQLVFRLGGYADDGESVEIADALP